MFQKISVGEFICKRRKYLKISQSELSAPLFLTPQAISSLERKSSAIAIDFLVRICGELKISLLDFHERKVDAAELLSPEPIDIQLVSQKLYQARKRKGVSRLKAAELTNISDKSIRNYEKGTQTPTIQYIEAFCDCFGHPFVDIVSSESPNAKVTKINRIPLQRK